MNRKYSIDILRIISAIAVVIIHVVGSPVANSLNTTDAFLVSQLNLIHALMNWSVPVFFMITGYCVLRKSECSYKYCFSHVIKYIFVLFTVGLFYALLEEIFVAKTINISIFLQSLINVISGNLWDHMWFVYAIIGIYLVLPVIHIFYHQCETEFYILTTLLFLCNIVFPSFEELICIKEVLPFSGYLFYVCFGGIAANQIISNKYLSIISLLGALSAIWIILKSESQNFGYNHLAMCLMAISIFLLINKINFKPSKFTLTLSGCTWGIYLIHPFL